METKKLYIDNVLYSVRGCLYERNAFILELAGANGKKRNMHAKVVWSQIKGNTTKLLLCIAGCYYSIVVQHTAQGATVLCNEQTIVVASSPQSQIKNNLQIQASRKLPVQKEVFKSPLAGKVIRLCVDEGNIVNKGDTLVVIESMKMENELRAPYAGIVKNLFIKTGDLLQTKQELMLLAQKEGEK